MAVSPSTAVIRAQVPLSPHILETEEDSPSPLQERIENDLVPLRPSSCHAGGRGSESRRPRSSTEARSGSGLSLCRGWRWRWYGEERPSCFGR